MFPSLQMHVVTSSVDMCCKIGFQTERSVSQRAFTHAEFSQFEWNPAVRFFSAGEKAERTVRCGTKQPVRERLSEVTVTAVRKWFECRMSQLNCRKWLKHAAFFVDVGTNWSKERSCRAADVTFVLDIWTNRQTSKQTNNSSCDAQNGFKYLLI